MVWGEEVWEVCWGEGEGEEGEEEGEVCWVEVCWWEV